MGGRTSGSGGGGDRLEGLGLAVRPLVLRQSRGGLGLGLLFQAGRDALDVAVEQDVQVEDGRRVEAVAVEGGEYPFGVDHQVGQQQGAGEGAGLGQPGVVAVEGPLGARGQFQAGRQPVGGSAG